MLDYIVVIRMLQCKLKTQMLELKILEGAHGGRKTALKMYIK